MFVFFRVLYILTNDFLFYLGCIYVLQAREWFGSTAITKTGPNDDRHVVWALGTMFFILIFFSCHSFEDLGCIYVLQAREWFRSTAITKTGPNDTRHVVWALGMFLFSFFRVLYILTNGFLFYLGCIYVLYAQEGFGWMVIMKTGPKDIRHVFWALGTIFLIFNFFSRSLYTN